MHGTQVRRAISFRRALARYRAKVQELLRKGYRGEELAELFGRVDMMEQGFLKLGHGKYDGIRGIDSVYQRFGNNPEIAIWSPSGVSGGLQAGTLRPPWAGGMASARVARMDQRRIHPGDIWRKPYPRPRAVSGFRPADHRTRHLDSRIAISGLLPNLW